MDISRLSIAELNNLRQEIDLQIARVKSLERQQVIDELKSLASSKGYSLDELLSGKTPSLAKPSKMTKKVAPKYVHPRDSSLTWTGRGKQPLWIKQLLSEGKSLTSLAII